MKSIKLFLTIFSIIVINTNSQLLLQNNRYDFRNTTTQDFNDLAEFVVCGIEAEGLNDLAYQIQQIYLDLKQPNWQNNVKMLFGRYWQNGSNYYTGCSNTQQTLQRFAVRQNLVWLVRNFLKKSGFRQQISCVDEIMMRQYLSDGFGITNNSRINVGPKLIRMVYHDSSDFNNLVDAYNNTFNGQSGVDFCFYSPLQSQNKANLSDNQADPNHNRGLFDSVFFVENNQHLLATWIDVPDVEVLGALVALEDWFKGPKINFKFGRRKGNCSKILCFDGMCKNESLFIKNSPASHEWSNLKNMDLFRNLGFNSKEFIALIGAHTIGGVNVCTGFGNLNYGAYCKKNYPSQGSLDDGSFFDSTPTTFDNQYFIALANIQLGANNNTKFPECNFLNQMEWGNPNPDFVQETVCERITHCNHTDRKASHLKNLRNVSYFGGKFRRIVSLPADWANLFDQNTQVHIQQFANNQTDFFNTFSSAYEKISNIGYSNNELQQCQPLGCNVSVDRTGFFCSGSFDDFLTFDVNTNPECSFPNSAPQNNCQLIGGYGVGGQIQCGNTQYRCPLRKSIENQQSIQKFLNQRVW